MEIVKEEEQMETLNVEDDELASKEIVIQKYFLKEWNVVKSLLDSILSNGRVSDMSVVYKIRSIVDKYQEQGQLIEPYLENTVTPLMLLICLRTREMGAVSDEVLGVIKPLCIIIYSLVTVCGHKAVVKFFPHHVSELELAVALLDACHGKDVQSSLRHESTGEMEAKCVILLWLSILVLVPFDICSVDSSITNVSCIDKYEQAPLVLKLTEIAKHYLSVTGPMCTIAGLLISRLITRPDMRQAFVSFVEWAHEIVSSFKDDVVEHFRLLGVVNALAAVFQVGSRKSLIDVVPIIWNDISKLMNSSSAFRSPLLRKVLVKLAQRIGLTGLPRRFPSWHYVKDWTNISLDQCESADRNLDASYFVPETGKNGNEEVMEVPDIVEEIIDMLLSGLRDTDTVVRWSAAKGIGRLTSCLTASQSDEVLSSLVELFSLHEGDGSWHGGCLALAELSRRGLLLPTSFPKVVPVLVKALHYDVRRGAHSVGSQVRDAAAYVCWAFGRAYCQSDMKDIINGLAPYLLRVACYDREVNCRRAAAAAFQENVGRQGSYSNGIEIVNSANYFSLSSRANSYLNVAVYIAQFEGFFRPFVDELLHRKILHWDKGLRELASQALSALVKYDSEYFASFVLEELIPLTLSSDLCTRHGATLAVAELVFALHQFGYIFSSEMQERVVRVVPAIEMANLYRGKGGEIMRLAVSRFIECLSLARLTLSEKLIHNLMDNLSENITHPNPQIQNAAVGALKHFVSAYIVGFSNHGSNDVTVKYVEKLNDANRAARRGSALAIGVLPYECLATSWSDVLMRLCKSCLIEENPADRDAEARVNAVKALVSVCETLCEVKLHTDDISVKDNMILYLLIKNEVMLSLFRALDDYSIDNRGDVGSWVREAALFGLERCTYLLCEKDSAMCSLGEFKSSAKHCSGMQPLFDAQLASTLVGVVLKQAVEKMDKLREAASNILWRILYNEKIFIPSIPFREKLEEVVPKSADSKWSVPGFSYPLFVQLLQFSCYSKFVLSGLVTSTGGLQDSLRKTSMLALTEYIQGSLEEDSIEGSRMSALCADTIWILQHYRKCDRVIIPTLKTIEILLSKRLLNIEDGASSFHNDILDCLAVELKGSKDFPKLYAAISILGYISSLSDCIQRKAFSQLLNYLAHRYPKIRKSSAEQVYLVLLQNENMVPANNMEKALEIVSETCWDGDIQHAKQRRLQLLVLAELEDVVPLQTHVSGAPIDSMKVEPTAYDENATYSALVGSNGY